MKRITDLFFGILIAAVLIPIFLVISLLIKFTSNGPILFVQKRIGLNKKEFNILKFRTMYVDAPKNVPTHLLRNPEKLITPVGRFLRKTSLDELPQIFNIIVGDMSFVGPRPALHNQYDLISLREACGVNKIRPGLTGWAQVNGRDELSLTEKVGHDKYYVENRSMLLDIKIILMTALNVFIHKGVVEGIQSRTGKYQM